MPSSRLKALLILLSPLLGCAELGAGGGVGTDENQAAAVNPPTIAQLFQQGGVNSEQPLQNLIYAPISLQRLMAMVYHGSSGDSKAAL
ncbi:MAG: hypothetical protein HQL48_04845, partial [Gammaproteobacteria bacterium]|nr:hypothetical protein [Gammaproteobacteria bacterium]